MCSSSIAEAWLAAQANALKKRDYFKAMTNFGMAALLFSE